MTDKKFTDNIEIIENLTEFLLLATDGYASSLENDGTRNKYQEHYIETLTDSINLINCQKAEIERLRGSTVVNNIMECQRIKREAKVEAYKEFAGKLENEINCRTTLSCEQDKNVIRMMHNLLKEMTKEEIL